MKLLTLQDGDDFHPAVLVGEDALDLVKAQAHIDMAANIPNSMRALLAGGQETLAMIQKVIDQASKPEVAGNLKYAGALVAFDSANLGPVVPDPKLFLSSGANSYGHVAEMGDKPPEEPFAFFKAPSAISASGKDILLPKNHSDMVDWEGEFCAVIGKHCHQVSEEEAPDYIVGYTLTNDVSTREYSVKFAQTRGANQITTVTAWQHLCFGKSFPTFAPVGPVITTTDEMPWPLKYKMETLVNGEVMQSCDQEDLVFNPAQMIAFLSDFVAFEPGDIISMGSPPGVGFARTPPVYLKSGDVVDIRVKEIGTLRNGVSK
ncbi:MAG: fumarylacetoacetate hydrolase family protein [Cellvibrionaceae bacterium]|nr:fumarylacetoacetate hydrolase family protein [Cellvibrionaceae bacterium]